jgi:hypothetical protein
VTLDIIQNPAFRTGCIRNKATTAAEKRTTYAAYGIAPPKNNTGKNQTCELDHSTDLGAGGADTLDNVWPQCGPPGVTLKQRYFKIKDAVETWLVREIKAGRMTLEEAQHGIAEDWSQYVPAVLSAKRRK